MKKLTLISIVITAIGLSLPSLAYYVLPFMVLVYIGNFLAGIGFIMIYVFLIAWQAEVSRTRLIITTILLGLLFQSFVIYGIIKADEAEKMASASYEWLQESDKKIEELTKDLIDKQSTISILENKLKECDN